MAAHLWLAAAAPLATVDAASVAEAAGRFAGGAFLALPVLLAAALLLRRARPRARR
jgi:hypothetical protein